MKRIPLYISTLLILSCQPEVKDSKETEIISNPHAPGFNLEGSDEKAIVIADKVMEALGGRKNWDETRYLSWSFFGNRIHTWDRYEGRDSIYIPKDSLVIDLNINTMEGNVYIDGREITDADSLSKYIEQGRKQWINDSYWLIMPFKLKDSGVTLKYLGEETDMENSVCHKLQLTFENVGVTPDNKYQIFVDTTTNLVSQWDFFRSSDLDSASFSNPWKNYSRYGNILLSGDRGKRSISEIKVLNEWP